MPGPLLTSIDCMMLPVTDLEAAVTFYRDKLSQPLAWRTDKAAALRIGESELLLNPGPPRSRHQGRLRRRGGQRFVEAGGSIVAGPFDIKIGKCVVVKDPWGNHLVLLDSTKGLLQTDAAGNVV